MDVMDGEFQCHPTTSCPLSVVVRCQLQGLKIRPEVRMPPLKGIRTGLEKPPQQVVMWLHYENHILPQRPHPQPNETACVPAFEIFYKGARRCSRSRRSIANPRPGSAVEPSRMALAIAALRC